MAQTKRESGKRVGGGGKRVARPRASGKRIGPRKKAAISRANRPMTNPDGQPRIYRRHGEYRVQTHRDYRRGMAAAMTTGAVIGMGMHLKGIKGFPMLATAGIVGNLVGTQVMWMSSKGHPALNKTLTAKQLQQRRMAARAPRRRGAPKSGSRVR